MAQFNVKCRKHYFFLTFFIIFRRCYFGKEISPMALCRSVFTDLHRRHLVFASFYCFGRDDDLYELGFFGSGDGGWYGGSFFNRQLQQYVRNDRDLSFLPDSFRKFLLTVLFFLRYPVFLLLLISTARRSTGLRPRRRRSWRPCRAR